MIIIIIGCLILVYTYRICGPQDLLYGPQMYSIIYNMYRHVYKLDENKVYRTGFWCLVLKVINQVNFRL